ncbi:MAG: aldo/keto reductase, partial [Synergistaceae bacterium]|nr:aldo/keto reductase [Synergistaceae bacterium]
GFRLIDYSAAYGDGKLIGRAIRKSGVKREDLILTTRVSNGAQFTGKIEDEFFAQLRNFGTDYADILMFHWPVTGCYTGTWLKMLELKEKGYCRVLGAANCNAHHLEELEKASGVLPEIDQFEVHPLFTQKELREYCRAKGIQAESYTPVARFDDRLMRLPVLRKIAEKYSRTVTQVVLRWHIQSGLVPVVRTLNPLHQKENIDVFGFSLTDGEMSVVDSVNINARVRYDPDNCDFTIL